MRHMPSRFSFRQPVHYLGISPLGGLGCMFPILIAPAAYRRMQVKQFHRLQGVHGTGMGARHGLSVGWVSLIHRGECNQHSVFNAAVFFKNLAWHTKRTTRARCPQPAAKAGGRTKRRGGHAREAQRGRGTRSSAACKHTPRALNAQEPRRSEQQQAAAAELRARRRETEDERRETTRRPRAGDAARGRAAEKRCVRADDKSRRRQRQTRRAPHPGR